MKEMSAFRAELEDRRDSERVKRISAQKGKEENITVYRSPLLARALFFTSDIGKEISEKLYNAVAVALAYIYKIDKGELVDEPEIEIPEDLRFNENGNLIRDKE